MDAEKLAQLERAKGEAEGLVQILREKLREAEEENWNVQATVATAIAEIEFLSKKKEQNMSKQVASLESNLAFVTQQLKTAERVKLVALREVDDMKQKQTLEQKRLEAEKRLLATKKRKHESIVIAASQTIRMAATRQPVFQVSQASQPLPVVTATATTAVQTEQVPDAQGLMQENVDLISALMNSPSRDLLALLNGSSNSTNKPEDPVKEGSDESSPAVTGNTLSQAAAESADGDVDMDMVGSTPSVGFSQSVFSQIADQAQAQARASMLSFAMETNVTKTAFMNERATELYDILADMLQGKGNVLALTPVFIKYLTAPTDLDPPVLSSVMSVLYSVIHHSKRFRQFLLSSTGSGIQTRSSHASSSLQHPRITLPGMHFSSLEDYLASKRGPAVESTAAEDMTTDKAQQRIKLLSALCRVIKNNLNQSKVVDHALCVFSIWVDLALLSPSFACDFTSLLNTHVLQEIMMSPKSVPRTKCMALNLMTQLLRFPDLFHELEASAKKSFLFNRCAMMLSQSETAWTREVQLLQQHIIQLFLAIIMAYPSTGTRFVLENTRGDTSDANGYRGVVFHVTQLLDRCTRDMRLASRTTSPLCADDDKDRQNKLQVALTRDAFVLTGLLVPYVDLSVELDGADHEHAFLSVLYLLSSTRLDYKNNDSISKIAACELLKLGKLLLQPIKGTCVG